MPTVITSNMNLGKAPTRANLPQTEMLAAQDAAFEKPATNPNAVFGAYASQQLGGAGTRSKFGRGTVITSGPMRGMQMGKAKEKMRQDLAKAPDSVKQAAMDRASGADLMPGYKAPAAESGRLDTYGMGGKVEYKGLDYLTAGRKSGADLAQMEKNVAATGDRNRSAPARTAIPRMRDTSVGKEAVPTAMPAKTAVTASATAPVSATPTASVPLAQVQPTAPNPTPMRGMTGLGNPMENTRGMTGLGNPMATPAAPAMTAVTAAMNGLDKGLGQAETAKRAFLAKASMPAPTDQDLADKAAIDKEAKNAKLRAANPGIKPGLIPGFQK